jgi:hypothetical protein
VGCTVSEGVEVGSGVSVGLGVGVSSGTDGLGIGDFPLCFRFVSDVGLGDGVGEAFLLFGDAVGDGLGASFLAGCFQCFRVGVGVGVGSKIFLIFVPNDSSAASGAAMAPKKIAQITTPQNVVLIAGNNQLASS